MFFLCFLALHLWHMEGPRLGIESELQLPACSTATATATQDLGHICNLHTSSQQRHIRNPLSRAVDQTPILMDTSRVFNPLSHNGNSLVVFCLFVCLFVLKNGLRVDDIFGRACKHSQGCCSLPVGSVPSLPPLSRLKELRADASSSAQFPRRSS